ncbi:MAG: hypothetical protein MRJ65_17810 [Candidatus Brocadiaceae bacterium]|nr:hypothetical protein [Candidatus Brocadiaceae bacterium]
MIMGFVIIGPESTAGLIGLITLQMKVDRESVVREICMLRLTRRGLETGFRVPRQVLDPTDEKMLEIGYGRDSVTLSKETERNREYKHQPVATAPVFYSTKNICFFI